MLKKVGLDSQLRTALFSLQLEDAKVCVAMAVFHFCGVCHIDKDHVIFPKVEDTSHPDGLEFTEGLRGALCLLSLQQEPVLFLGDMQINIEGEGCQRHFPGAEADLGVDVVQPCFLHLQFPLLVGYQAVRGAIHRFLPFQHCRERAWQVSSEKETSSLASGFGGAPHRHLASKPLSVCLRGAVSGVPSRGHHSQPRGAGTPSPRPEQV